MTTEQLIRSFRQGGTGNCVTIAIIKAAIQVFGLHQVFVCDQQDTGAYTITMRDGMALEVTLEEATQAAAHSKFIVLANQEVFDYANLCFAAMAKRAQLESNDGSGTYEEALASLNDGEYYLEGPHWLGLRHHVRSVGLKYVWQYPGVVGASAKHCFFASHKVADNYGTPDPIKWYEVKYKFFKYFRLDATAMY